MYMTTYYVYKYVHMYLYKYVCTYMDCPAVAQCRAILLVTVVVRWCDCVTVYSRYSMCAVID